MEVSEWESAFQSWCQETYVHQKSTHFVITSEYADKVISVLKNPEDIRTILSGCDKSQVAKFKFKVISIIHLYLTSPKLS